MVRDMPRLPHRQRIGLGLVALLLSAAGAQASSFITISNGYFWDAGRTNYWVPHGFAYQTINPPVFATQTAAQIAYDFLEMRKMHADSLRVDFTWGYIEPTNDVYDWTATDAIVSNAAALGLKVFPLIGYQYPPSWFPNDLKNVNQNGGVSDVINYEHPAARSHYTDFIARVTARYKDSTAIAGWILGNEYAYFDLWEVNDPHRFLGYETNYSRASFIAFLTNHYSGSIAALNANWQTGYASFSDVVMATNYPSDRHNPGYHDLIQWRKKSIGDFVAIGAVAAKNADTNHLCSYSMVGGIFNGMDANHTCEDAKTIVERCAAAGAPLDFWSINNYAWALQGSELRTAQFGITKYQDQSGLPVLITETGHSSTENLFPGAATRQAAALPGQVWEALMAGAAGVHIFTWNDRPLPQVREQGFGIVGQNRIVKNPVYWNILEVFRRMEQVNVHRLFGGSAHPRGDIQFLWSEDADMGWPRANQENCMLWGGLKRLGYEPRFIDEDQFDAGQYTSAPVLLVSRAYQLDAGRLNALTNVVAAGIHLHANADLPGQYNAYHAPNTNWIARMDDLFGLDVGSATCVWMGGVSGTWDAPFTRIDVAYSNSLAPITTSYRYTNLISWNIWTGITVAAGTTIVGRTTITNSTAVGGSPALHIKGHASARSAINPWTLGDTLKMSSLPNSFNLPEEMALQLHYDWGKAIYRTWFGIQPAIDLTSTSSYFYVCPDYRICTNGSVLISLLNESTNPVTVTLYATGLLSGKIVEQISSPSGIVSYASSGSHTFRMAGDEYLLIYAYSNGMSLVNTNSRKVWITSEPLGMWPNGYGYSVGVGFDTGGGAPVDLFVALRDGDQTNVVYAVATNTSLLGQGTRSLVLNVPDYDLHNSDYASSRDGGTFRLQAWLGKNGTNFVDSLLDTRVLWGVAPAWLPAGVQTGQTYNIPLFWQELPGYNSWEVPTPLGRAGLWEPSLSNSQAYRMQLSLLRDGVTVASTSVVTTTETDSRTLPITVPNGYTSGVFSWHAEARTVSGGMKDVVDGFEDRANGPGAALFGPWTSFSYAQNNNATIYAEGVHGAAVAEGTNSLFMAVGIPSPNSYAGFGILYQWPMAWQLPPGPQRSNIAFALKFIDTNSLGGVIELKLEDSTGGTLSYTTAYRGNGWTNVSARLDQFTGSINTNDIKRIVALLQATNRAVTYLGCFDDIRFTGADAMASTNGTVYAVYRSDNDTLFDSDGDGLADRYETWWGSWQSGTNTGSNPNDADSDDDGQGDGDEVVAGVDPNNGASYFAVDSVTGVSTAGVVVTWNAVSGRTYRIEYAEGSVGASSYASPAAWTNIAITNSGTYSVTDTTATGSAQRSYRIGVRL
jgi:hypothetical protein